MNPPESSKIFLDVSTTSSHDIVHSNELDDRECAQDMKNLYESYQLP